MILSSLTLACDPTNDEEEESSTDLSYLKSSNPTEVDNSDLPVTPIVELNTTGSLSESPVTSTTFKMLIEFTITTVIKKNHEVFDPLGYK